MEFMILYILLTIRDFIVQNAPLLILAGAGAIVSAAFWYIGHRKPKKEQLPPLLTTWTTRDGRTMFISDMTDDHLKNAINFLSRRIKDLQGMRAKLFIEQNRRGIR
jgi:hypothetical protein